MLPFVLGFVVKRLQYYVMRYRLLMVLLCVLPLVVGEEEESVPPSDYDSPAKLILEGVPPSPSAHPGKRIWPDPRFTHWPAIIYEDERRNIAFELPVRVPGVEGSLDWKGGAYNPFRLPAGGQADRISGLVDLPQGAGTFPATFTIGPNKTESGVRIVDYSDPWPHADVVDDFPVDESGTPVILRIPRRDPERERQWALLKPDLPRPEGRPLVVGSPLRAMGVGVFDDLSAEIIEMPEGRRSTNIILTLLAGQFTTWPSTLIISPGNDALFARMDLSEEIRLLEALSLRAQYDQVGPRFVLLLPPIPLNDYLQEAAKNRREALERQARILRWVVVDAEKYSGPAEQANLVAEGVFTRYANGEAQNAIRSALVKELRQ